MSTASNVVKHHVGHHFSSADQEFDSAKLGMWLFLTTEILLFGGLFCAYLIFRVMYPEIFHEGGKSLDWRMGALNTFILFTSSFTMAWAVRNAQLNEFKKLSINLAITFLCAGGFLVIKGIEYAAKFEHGTLWGGAFSAAGFEDPRTPVFFGIYFLMTGLHGIHVIIGMSLILWLYIRSLKRHFYDEYFTPVEMVGLYWGVVDAIWIFLFPLFYLINGVR